MTLLEFGYVRAMRRPMGVPFGIVIMPPEVGLGMAVQVVVISPILSLVMTLAVQGPEMQGLVW